MKLQSIRKAIPITVVAVLLFTVGLFKSELTSQIQDRKESVTGGAVIALPSKVNVAPTDNQSEQYEILQGQMQTIVEQLRLMSTKVDAVEEVALASVRQMTESSVNAGTIETEQQEVAEVSFNPREQMAQQISAIENSFQHEEYDPSWSQLAESRLQAAFSSQSLENHAIQTVECRATLCKLEVTGANGGKAGGFHEALREQILDILPAGAMMPNGNGVTVFLAQDSASLALQRTGTTHSVGNARN